MKHLHLYIKETYRSETMDSFLDFCVQYCYGGSENCPMVAYESIGSNSKDGICNFRDPKYACLFVLHFPFHKDSIILNIL